MTSILVALYFSLLVKKTERATSPFLLITLLSLVLYIPMEVPGWLKSHSCSQSPASVKMSIVFLLLFNKNTIKTRFSPHLFLINWLASITTMTSGYYWLELDLKTENNN